MQIERSVKMKYKQSKTEFSKAAKVILNTFGILSKNINKKGKVNSNISNDEFHTYFKKMFTGTDQFVNEDVENTVRSQLDCDEADAIVIYVLDAEFSTDEVEKAITDLKRDKSPGVITLSLKYV